MGAQESRSQQEADNDGSTPQDDYYTILEVDENATADEIRVSFLAITARMRSRFFFFFGRVAFFFLLRRNGKIYVMICCRASLKK